MKLQYEFIHHRGAWICTTEDYDGAPDSNSPIGVGATKEEARDALLERFDLATVPTEVSEAFQLDMAEKGIHHDDWCDRFGEWLADHVEVA